MERVTIIARDSKHLVELKRKYIPYYAGRRVGVSFKVDSYTYEGEELKWREYYATHPWYCSLEEDRIVFANAA